MRSCILILFNDEQTLLLLLNNTFTKRDGNVRSRAEMHEAIFFIWVTPCRGSTRWRSEYVSAVEMQMVGVRWPRSLANDRNMDACECNWHVKRSFWFWKRRIADVVSLLYFCGDELRNVDCVGKFGVLRCWERGLSLILGYL